MTFSFSQALLAWFKKYGRHDLPWQKPRTPYRVWLSEVMLQQTQVATVIPYFEKFMLSFTTVKELAEASLDDVLAHWAGLGYYSRARNLHCAAQMIMQDFQGEFPDDVELLQKLPGVGRSTAGAIVAQAFGKFSVIMDGNVKRVLCRFHAIHGDPTQKEINQQLWQLATEHTPQRDLVSYTQAIMDLGATVCVRQKPKCEICPLKPHCQAYQRRETHLLPSKKARKELPIRERFFALVMHNDEILLSRNSFDNIWKGLWNLPNDEDLTNLTLDLGVTIKNSQALEQFRHTFSHFHLIIKPVLIQAERQIMVCDSNQQQWVKLKDLAKIGLAAPIKKLINNTQNF